MEDFVSGKASAGSMVPRPRASVCISSLQPLSDRLGNIVFRNFMYRSFVVRMREAMYVWLKNVNITPPISLVPETEMRLENKRLRRRSQLLEPGASSTMSMVRRRLVNMFSSTLRVSVRKAFDRWRSLSKIVSYQIEMQRQHIKVEIGMQHIRSEKKKISEIRDENNKLQSWLLCSVFFMKWKIEDMKEKLLDERDLRFKEREIVYKRIDSLKKRLLRAQQVERDALATAALRGNEFCQRMNSLQLEFEMTMAPTKQPFLSSPESESPVKRSGLV